MIANQHDHDHGDGRPSCGPRGCGDCQFGRTWGVDRGEVWVDKGCRAAFVVY
ncbi:DUF3011 domain-containing protein [Silanimonas algicola]